MLPFLSTDWFQHSGKFTNCERSTYYICREYYHKFSDLQ